MSYVDYDHAEWVEWTGAAVKRRGGKLRRDRYGEAMGWEAMPEKLTPFQRRVMHILGVSLGGIYNAPITWKSVRWGDDERYPFMLVPVRHGFLATYDFNQLTMLVLCCHQARIRLEIRAHGGFGGLALHFSQRLRHADSVSGFHPNIAEMVAQFRAYVPADHPLTYPGDEP